MKESTNPLTILVCGTHRLVLLKLKCASQLPRGLVITQIAGSHAIIPSDTVVAAGLQTTDLDY